MTLSSLKLRFFDEHVRAVPAHDRDGCPFEGPGVDVRGDAARHIILTAHPVLDWFAARDASASLRSVSFDFQRRRVLSTLVVPGMLKPMVLRVDAPDSGELFDALAPVLPLVREACTRALELRGVPR